MRFLFTTLLTLLTLVAHGANFPSINVQGTTSTSWLTSTNYVLVGPGNTDTNNNGGWVIPGGISLVGGISTSNDELMYGEANVFGTNQAIFPYYITINDNGYTGGDCNGFSVRSSLAVTNSVQALYFASGEYAITGAAIGDGGGKGEGVGLVGSSIGGHAINYGLVGVGNSTYGYTATNIAVAGTVKSGNSSVAGYFEAVTSLIGPPANPVYQPSVMLLDSRDSGYALIVGRTNNGTQVFQVANNGSIFTAGNASAQIAAGNTNVVDLTYASRTNNVTANLSLVYATNAVDGVDVSSVLWLKNTTGGNLTFAVNSNWHTNFLSAVPPALTNGTVTKVYLSFIGSSATSALQTNGYVSFEYYK